MNFITILLFFIYTYCLGFSVTYFIKNKPDFYELTVMRIAAGLACFPLIISLLGLLTVPIDWKIFLAISLLIPVYSLIKSKGLPRMSKINTPSIYFILAFILFIFAFSMYTQGAFAYPWLENDDSWAHALSVKYVAEQKVLYEPFEDKFIFHYLDARPPGYDGILAVLHQTSPDLTWTLKFFNSLIISLAILFFFFFARRFTNSPLKAFISTFIITMIPSFMSHFIWSHALIIGFIITALYFYKVSDHDNYWLIPFSIACSGIFLTQETQSVKFLFIIGIFVVIDMLIEKKILFNKIAAIGAAGIAALLVWWGPMIIKYGGISGLLSLGIRRGIPNVEKFVHPSITIDPIGTLGSATRQHGIYTLKEFFSASAVNMINNPIGVGFLAMSLAVLGLILVLIYKNKLIERKYSYLLITLCWFIFTFFGIHGGTRWWSPVALFSFRFWMLFSIPTALLAAEGIMFMANFFRRQKPVKFGVIIVLLIGIIFTSGLAKYELNTMVWNPGGRFQTQDDVAIYIWAAENLPDNTKVFPLSGMDELLIGLNLYSCKWCHSVNNFRKTIGTATLQDTKSFLSEEGYSHILIDSTVKNGEHLIPLIDNSTRFQKVAQSGPTSVYQIQ